MATPEGKTIAVDGGGLVRVCPVCGEHVELEAIVSDVWETIDDRGTPTTHYLPRGEKPDGSHGVSLQTGREQGPARRGEHTDYDDAAYRAHYESEHA